MNYAKALKCALLSQKAYGNASAFSALDVQLIEGKATDTQCFILTEKAEPTTTELFIAFRGSDSDLDWGVNFNFRQAAFEYFKQEVLKEDILENKQQIYPYAGKSQSGSKMHQGFVNAYKSVRKQIHEFITKNHAATRLTVTGHSLGGAVATLCAVDIQYNFGAQFGGIPATSTSGSAEASPPTSEGIELYTFGCPRVGNSGFRDSFNRRIPHSFRFVYGMDLVPAFPRTWQSYSHVEQEHRLGKRLDFDFITRRFQDHKLDNYINALRAEQLTEALSTEDLSTEAVPVDSFNFRDRP